MQAEGYSATINHEMRTPLASVLFLLRTIIKIKDIQTKLALEEIKRFVLMER